MEIKNTLQESKMKREIETQQESQEKERHLREYDESNIHFSRRVCVYYTCGWLCTLQSCELSAEQLLLSLSLPYARLCCSASPNNYMKLATPCMEMSRNYFLLCVSLAHSNYFMLHFLGARRRPNESDEHSLPSQLCILTSAKASLIKFKSML
jgi:hypothetical protein